MTNLYLAVGDLRCTTSFGARAVAAWDWGARPLGVLVSLPYLKVWDALVAARPAIRPCRLMLDSGAYSAWRSGKVVDILDLAVRTLEPRWTESVGLDVIGSAEGSRANADELRELGSPAMPVFHVGDPWPLLDHYVAHWPKVGLSCRFGETLRESLRFYDMCFARAWPHRFHSFGWTQRDVLLRYPFHSADSTTWRAAAGAYRQLRDERGRVFAARGAPSPAVDRYLEVHMAGVADVEDELRAKWGRELAAL